MQLYKYAIMVIEDEELLLQAIVRKLEKHEITPISCTNGEQALDYLRNVQHLPDAIWLDYYLKDMNGLEFMGELKKNQQWATIPVIVVSNSASEPKVQAILDLGAKKYLLKAEHRLDDIISEITHFIPEKNMQEKDATQNA